MKQVLRFVRSIVKFVDLWWNEIRVKEMSIQWSNIVVQIGRFPDCQSKDPRSNSRWIHFNQVSIFYQLFPSHYYFNHCYRSWIQESLKITTMTSRSTGCNVYIFIHRIYLYYHLRYWRKSFQRRKRFPKFFFFLKTRKKFLKIMKQKSI